MIRSSLCISALFLLHISASFADVSVPAIFSDHMVLQKAAKVPFWGKADPGEEITVKLGKRTATATAGPDGKWMTSLDLKDSSAGPFQVSIKGKNVIDISDVVVGQVWLASGQSNMEWTLARTSSAPEEIAQSANPLLRQFLVQKATATAPTDAVAGQWVLADPATSGNFSGVGYYFAKSLQKSLKVPVGLIHSSWGGTPSEAWTSMDAIKSLPELLPSTEKQWIAHEAAAQAPASSAPNLHPEHVPGYLFNGMIHPVVPYAIKGVIWYQGENNAGRGFHYRTVFPLLINDWRKQWAQGDFPFYFCQLANFMPKVSEPQESDWPELREAQSFTLSLPNTGQAVLIDIGEAADIHPINKKDVGERLALIALARDYGRKTPYSGPVYQSMKVENGKLRLTFTHLEGGLVARPLEETYPVNLSKNETAPLVRNSPNSKLEGFSICGEDKKWVWAEAEIDGDTVTVWSDKVPKPVAARYGWANNPTVNLYNKAGLPASPFRTDDFPLTTQNIKY